MRVTLAVETGVLTLLSRLVWRANGVFAMSYADRFGTPDHAVILNARGLMFRLYAESVRVMQAAASRGTEVTVKDWLSGDMISIALRNGREARFERKNGVVTVSYVGFGMNAPMDGVVECEPNETIEAATTRWMDNVVRALTGS